MNSGMGKAAAVGMVVLGFSLPPVWADEKHGDGKEYGAGGGHGMAARHGGTGHYLRHLLKHQKEIGLSEEQVGKLKAIQLDLDRTRIRAEADILVAERELAALVEDEKTDLSAIEAKVKQSEALEAGLRIAAIKVKREATALLTPEQREKEKAEHDKMMKTMMREYGGHDKGGRMKGMGDGHGGASLPAPKKADN